MPEILAPMPSKSFAIIGTREPDEQQKQFAYHAAWAISHVGGHEVRTGGAHGVDELAMKGTRGLHLTVYLPWALYNRDIVPASAKVIVYNPSIHLEWTESVRKYHPAPGRLTRGAFALHARNYGIVVGTNGVIALPDEASGGGTGQGIRIAVELGIPLVIANRGAIDDLPRFMGKALQTLGLASKQLSPIYSAETLIEEHEKNYFD